MSEVDKDSQKSPNSPIESPTPIDDETVVCIELDCPTLPAEKLNKQSYEIVAALDHQFKDKLIPIAKCEAAHEGWKRNHRDRRKLNWEEKGYIHWFFLLVAAFMFSRAARVALLGVAHAEWLSLVVALNVFLADWLIAELICFLLLRNDAQVALTDIQERLKEAKEDDSNELHLSRFKAEKQIFGNVQGEFLSNKRLIMICMMQISGIAFLIIEYFAAIYYIRQTGNNLDGISYAVCLLAVVITIMLGLYKGFRLDYPHNRQLVATKYRQALAGLQKIIDFNFKLQVAILNDLGNFLLRNPRPTGQEFDEHEKKLWCNMIYQEHNATELNHVKAYDEVREAHKQEREKIYAEHKGAFPDKALAECDRIHDRKLRSMEQKHKKELEPIARRILDHGGKVPQPMQYLFSSDQLPALESSTQPPHNQNGHSYTAPQQTYVSLVDED